jgi:hypothetical protein
MMKVLCSQKPSPLKWMLGKNKSNQLSRTRPPLLMPKTLLNKLQIPSQMPSPRRTRRMPRKEETPLKLWNNLWSGDFLRVC